MCLKENASWRSNGSRNVKTRSLKAKLRARSKMKVRTTAQWLTTAQWMATLKHQLTTVVTTGRTTTTALMKTEP